MCNNSISVYYLKGYVPDGHQTGTACGKYPAGVDQFTEIKVIHSGAVQYRRPEVRDDQHGAAAVDAFQRHVKGIYIANLKEKDRQHGWSGKGFARRRHGDGDGRMVERAHDEEGGSKRGG